MIRKIIGNLLVGTLLPVLASFRWWPNIYNAILYKEYEYYDFHIETLRELLNEIYGEYFLSYIIFLFLLLLPFQLIKDYCFRKKNKRLALWKKCLILTGIIVLEFLVLFRGPITQMQVRVVLFGSMLLMGIIIALILYISVDRYVERPSN